MTKCEQCQSYYSEGMRWAGGDWLCSVCDSLTNGHDDKPVNPYQNASYHPDNDMTDSDFGRCEE